MPTRKEEDYLDVIYTLIKTKGYARVKDIAHELNVSPPSVVEMVRKFKDNELVESEKNAPILLSKKGTEIARVVKIKHETFRKFFKMILVPEEIAKKDSLKIEHNLHSTTIEQLKKFIDFFEKENINKVCIGEFEDFCKKK
jgi:DtxR family Mn-dependent transcriptional regulator